MSVLFRSLGVGCLMLVASAGYSQASAEKQVGQCQENLAKIDGATEQLALEKRLRNGTTVTMEMLVGSTFLKKPLDCPTSGTYTVGPVGTLPTCTIKAHNLTNLSCYQSH